MSTALYQEAIISLSKDQSDAGRLENPTTTATMDNPLCGDRVTLDINLQDGVITAIKHHVRGCALCKASAALIAHNGVGRSADQLADSKDALAAFLGGKDEDQNPLNQKAFAGLDVFEPVKAHKSRHDCVLLPFHTAVEAIAQISRSEE